MTDKMVVLSNALEGKDDVYNDWYDNVHAGDVLTRLRGYTGVTRYTVAERQLASPVVWSYLALWDVDATLGLAEAVESIRELRVIKKSGDFDPSDTLYRANPAINGATSTWFRQIERVDGNRGPDADDDHLLTVFSNNQPGRDDEFQEWYAQHCRDVVFKLSAFKSAERYIAFDDQLEEPAYRHLLIYRISQAERDKAQDEIVWQRTERAEALEAGRGPLITTSDTMSEPHAGWWFSPLSSRSLDDVATSSEGRA